MSPSLILVLLVVSFIPGINHLLSKSLPLNPKPPAMTTTLTTLDKKLTWLITGCSSGFGLSLTRLAQAGGHTVIATSRNPSKTPELVSEIESKGGKWLSLDVTDPNSEKVISDLEYWGTKIDVLVNNAGFSIFAAVETSSEEELRAQMESMYFGPLRLIRAVLPGMRKRRVGVVVNMSSGASLEGAPSMGGYAGAKAGLDSGFPLFPFKTGYRANDGVIQVLLKSSPKK